MAKSKKRMESQTVSVSGRFMELKQKKNKNLSESFSCPQCSRLLTDQGSVRLRSNSLTPHMQKLLRKQQRDEESLTGRQRELLQRAMQRCSVLAMRCRHCEWKADVKLLSRESVWKHKAQLREKAELERQKAVADPDDAVDEKKTQKKQKKKERKKKVAETKAKELQQFKRFSTSTNNAADRFEAQLSSIPPSTSSTPTSSSMLLTPAPSASLPSSSSTPSSTPSSRPAEMTSPFSSPTLPPSTKSRKLEKSSTCATPCPFQTKEANNGGRVTTTPQSDPRASSSSSARHLHSNGKGNQKKGKAQLRQMLSQKKRESLSANDSLSQFINSLK